MTRAGLILLGGGGHAKVVAETAQAAGWLVAGVFDPGLSVEQRVLGLPVLGTGEDLAPFLDGGYAFVPAIGAGSVRWKEFGRLRAVGATIATLVHPAAIVSPSATVGEGTVVMAGAVIQAETTIGAAAIINTGATIDHDCRIGNGVMVAPGATLCGGVTVGDHAFIAAGAVLVSGVTVGCSAFVGAGTVVVDPLPDGTKIASVRRSSSSL